MKRTTEKCILVTRELTTIDPGPGGTQCEIRRARVTVLILTWSGQNIFATNIF